MEGGGREGRGKLGEGGGKEGGRGSVLACIQVKIAAVTMVPVG